MTDCDLWLSRKSIRPVSDRSPVRIPAGLLVTFSVRYFLTLLFLSSTAVTRPQPVSFELQADFQKPKSGVTVKLERLLFLFFKVLSSLPCIIKATSEYEKRVQGTQLQPEKSAVTES